MAIEFKPNFSRLRQFFHLLPIGVIGLIPFSGADLAQMRMHYSIRGPISPRSELIKNIHVLTIENTPSSLAKISLLHHLNPGVNCINLSNVVTSSRCQKANLDQKPDEASFVQQVHFAFFKNQHASRSHFETIYYYGKLDVFSPSPLERMLTTEIENLPAKDTVILVDENQKHSERWSSPYGFLSTQELALTVIFNHLQHDSFRIQPQYSIFLVTLFFIIAIGALTYTYPLTLAIALSVTMYAFFLVIAMTSFERYGYQLSIFAPTLGIFLSYLVSISDQLNQKRRLEYHLGRQQEDLGQLDVMRQNFLSLVSHDLKTPIAKIQVLMEKLLSEDIAVLAPQQKQIIESVLAANHHLEKTIATLFLLNRIESNQVKIHSTPNDLQAVLDQSIESLVAQADEAGITINAELEPMFLSNFDRDLIREVADNLISNAIKYSPHGSNISIRCGDDDNALELSPPQPAIWFEVQDSGPGIPQEDRERVLQKFQRGAKEATSKGQSVKGTGLGLYLARYFVEEHQGRLVLISKTQNEPLHSKTTPYFASSASGTVIRVVIPTESS